MKNKLRDIIVQYGLNVVEEKKKLESLMNDLLVNESKRELNILKTALREGIVKELKDSGESRAAICVVKLSDEHGIDNNLSVWTVGTWLFAIFGKEFVVGSSVKVQPAKTEPQVLKPVEKQILKPSVPIPARNDDMVFVRGGYFNMGSNDYDNEKPIHKVWLDDFYICKFEVTQRKWKEVMGSNPSYFTGDNLPVERVSWNNVQEYLSKLNAKTGKKYRLPREAEWEYAARGGNQSKGNKYSGSNNIEEVAWYDGNSGRKTHPVGTKKPNELGIFDMSGNVWEWCNDWYDASYYKNSPEQNPKGASSGAWRLLRGGSWVNSNNNCRVSDRDSNYPDLNIIIIGFRVVEDL